MELKSVGHKYDDAYDSADTMRSHSPPPPSYDTLAGIDADGKDHRELFFGNSPEQLTFKDPIAGPSTRLTLPTPLPPASVEQQPQHSHEASHQPMSSQQSMSSSQPPQRPQLPHAARSAPDPRGRARLEHITELEEVDPFGFRFHEESTFEAARRAQRADDTNVNDARPRKHAHMNGRIPSVKPGEIMPGYTMRPPSGLPAFSPPLEAPPFPPMMRAPTIHTPIRPAHFPPQMHPPSPTQQAPPPPPRSLLRQQTLPQPPQLVRSSSHRHPAPPPSPPQQPYPPMPSPARRHTYDSRAAIPSGLGSNGTYGTPPIAVPLPHPPPVPHSHGLPQLQPHPPLYQPPGPQPQHQHPPPGRSILKDPQRHSLTPSRSPLGTPSPTPVRLPSQNVPPLNAVVHAPPAPSGSPRPDPTRPPGRPTPKPVMPQLLAPLGAQDYNHSPLQRSASTAALTGGGLLSKTRSLLKKRTSSSGIKTHADGAISFAPRASLRYENQMPVLPPLKEESGSGGDKLGKRLSKRR